MSEIKVTEGVATSVSATIESVASVSSSSSSSASASAGASFVSGFSEAEFETAWTQMASQIEASFKVEDTTSDAQDARHWEQLEGWLLKNYTARLKSMALQVARMELMVKMSTRLTEARLESTFAAWARHFDERFESVVNQRVTAVINTTAASFLERSTVDIRNAVIAMFEAEMDARIVAVIEHRLTAIRAELHASLDAVDKSFDSRLEASLLRFKARLIADLSRDIDQMVTTTVRTAVSKVDLTVAVGSIRSEMNLVSHQVARVENELRALLIEGDRQEREWAAAQLLALKSCMTDRRVLVDLMTSLAAKLDTELEGVECVRLDRWAAVGASTSQAAASYAAAVSAVTAASMASAASAAIPPVESSPVASPQVLAAAASAYNQPPESTAQAPEIPEAQRADKKKKKGE